MNYVLVVRYSDKDKFLYHSPCFVAKSLEDALLLGRDVLAQEWSKISPHPPPDTIVDIIPGVLGVM